MGYRDEWYPQTVAALIQRFGQATPDKSGNRLPIISAVQTISVLGVLSPNVIRVLTQFNTTVTDSDGPIGAVPISIVSADGIITASGMMESVFVIGDGGIISWADYVAGIPDPQLPYNRAPLGTGTGYRTIWMPPTVTAGWTQSDIISQLREMMRSWQDAVNASADAIRSNADPHAPIGKDQNAAFWRALRSLTVTMDIVDENPPTELFGRVKAALGDSLDKTATWAGNAAADIATKVGETAGNVGKGFFAEAGVTAIAVAGIAVYLFLK